MNVAVFFETMQIINSTLEKSYYHQSYYELSQEISKKGVNFYIVRKQTSYEGNRKFSNSWQFFDHQLKETGPIVIDVLYDKGRFTNDGKIKVLNCDRVNKICTDKWMMYQMFSKFCPRTWLIKSQEELLSKMTEVQTKLAVIKPVEGEEGKSVNIADKSILLKNEYLFPVLLQEFIDTTLGISGIVKGLHDFRVVILNGKIVNAYYRTPPQNSYLANVAQGGTQASVEIANIPESALNIVSYIDSQMQECGDRFYGIDFGFTSEGPKIIEMNSRLGLDNSTYGEEFRRTTALLAETLIGMGYKE